MAATAAEKNLVLMEAAHWFYHPFRARMEEVINSGILGGIERVYGNFYFPGEKDEPSICLQIVGDFGPSRVIRLL